MKWEFLQALVLSPTFIRDFTLHGFGILLLTVLAARVLTILARHSGYKDLHRDIGGSATAADFTLTFPLFMFVLLLIVQLAMTVNTSLIVHYAAYTAARSAKVWAWDIDLAKAKLEHVAEQKTGTTRTRAVARYQLNHSRAEEIARRAARYTLIAASPVSSKVNSSPGPMPSQTLKQITQATGLSGRQAVLVRQARYAFDPANTTIEITKPSGKEIADWVTNVDANSWPIEAKVEYRMRLGVPIASRLLGEKGQGGYYRWIEAKIVLL